MFGRPLDISPPKTVIAGPDPAIQPVCKKRPLSRGGLDRRVKPGDDSL